MSYKPKTLFASPQALQPAAIESWYRPVHPLAAGKILRFGHLCRHDRISLGAGPGLQPEAGHSPPPSGSPRADTLAVAVDGGGTMASEGHFTPRWRVSSQ
jgi:hypothetical protein